MPDPLSFLTRVPSQRLGYMQQSMEGPSGIAKLLQTPGLNDGLMAFGLNMLASDQKRETFGQSLLRSASAGVGAGREAASREKYEEALAGMPPEMARVMSLLGPERGALLMAQGMMAGPPDPVTLAEGAQLRRPDGSLIAENERPATPEAAPTDVRTMEWLMTQPPDVQQSFRELFGPAPATVINTGDRAASSASQALGTDAMSRITSKASAAENAVGIAQNIANAQQVLANPAMAQVTGPGATIKTVVERFRDDPAARELAAQFDILTSDIMLQTIANFSGALSDRELSFIEKASGADRNMTVEELATGLALLQRITERDMRAYVDEIEAFDPAEFGVTDIQMRQHRQLANRVGDMLNSRDLRSKYGLD